MRSRHPNVEFPGRIFLRCTLIIMTIDSTIMGRRYAMVENNQVISIQDITGHTYMAQSGQ